jgi:hypothetical protein
MSLSFQGPHLETRYDETKQNWNLGIEALSMNAHVVYDINIWEPNLRKK